ncbi:hypothetical protein Spith_0911 [Spirochaeta thermophila DSM 6578]|uniref:Uncharacterized protein n=1 Tax=Winmispira thermophila (strain ATCC 700085 / DSM 6578 / Z-1203) TaxID=869211 RepID=G0GCA0_WINT7|nr:hypothetical protein [Spirochaeta thermophila]AEJ61185.1 hypothetical protein Spith_0911 [Spirochaeta thermophila DSM 6578]
MSRAGVFWILVLSVVLFVVFPYRVRTGVGLVPEWGGGEGGDVGRVVWVYGGPGVVGAVGEEGWREVRGEGVVGGRWGVVAREGDGWVVRGWDGRVQGRLPDRGVPFVKDDRLFMVGRFGRRVWEWGTDGEERGMWVHAGMLTALDVRGGVMAAGEVGGRVVVRGRGGEGVWEGGGVVYGVALSPNLSLCAAVVGLHPQQVVLLGIDGGLEERMRFVLDSSFRRPVFLSFLSDTLLGVESAQGFLLVDLRTREIWTLPLSSPRLTAALGADLHLVDHGDGPGRMLSFISSLMHAVLFSLPLPPPAFSGSEGRRVFLRHPGGVFSLSLEDDV